MIWRPLFNRNWKKLTDSRKRAKILTDNRKSHHPIETLFKWFNDLVVVMVVVEVVVVVVVMV